MIETAANPWWRYIVRRLAAYNVIWTLAGEYNMNDYGGLGLDFWKDLGASVAAEDPFDHILGAHPTPPAGGFPRRAAGEGLDSARPGCQTTA